jgi:hypothetical protein
VVCEDNPSLNGHLEAMLSTSDETLLNALVIPSNSVGSDLLCDAITLVNFQPEKDSHITYWEKSASYHGKNCFQRLGRPMPWEPVMNKQCKSCKSLNIRRSHRKGFLEKMLRFLMIRPYRCERCHRRFYAFL